MKFDIFLKSMLCYPISICKDEKKPLPIRDFIHMLDRNEWRGRYAKT